MTTTVTATADVMKKPVAADHLHYLPCSVNFTGETEVDERFRKLTEKNEETGVLTGSFRGFPLEGKSVSLPEKYTGEVWGVRDQDSSLDGYCSQELCWREGRPD